MTKRKLIVILIVAIGIITYIWWTFSKVISGYSNSGVFKQDFSFVKNSGSFTKDDSVTLSSQFREKCKVELTALYSDSSYYTLASFMRFEVSIRKYPLPATDLRKLALVYEDNDVDDFVQYDVKGNELFEKLIRVPGSKKTKIATVRIDGSTMKILKHTRDTLWIHGNIVGIAVGTASSVNERWKMKRPGLFGSGTEAEFMLLNRNGTLYEYFLAPNASGINVPMKALRWVK